MLIIYLAGIQCSWTISVLFSCSFSKKVYSPSHVMYSPKAIATQSPLLATLAHPLHIHSSQRTVSFWLENFFSQQLLRIIMYIKNNRRGSDSRIAINHCGVCSGKATQLDLVSLEILSIGSARSARARTVPQSVNLDCASRASLLEGSCLNGVGCSGFWWSRGWRGHGQERQKSEDGGGWELHVHLWVFEGCLKDVRRSFCTCLR
jgi:hypothetical protein